MTAEFKCPICESAAHLFDVVDFNKSCEEIKDKFLPLLGRPIYYARCNICDFCFSPEMCAWEEKMFKEHIYNDEYIIVDPEHVSYRPNASFQDLCKTFPNDEIKNIKHLDYGSGNGLLSELLRKEGWNSTSYDPFYNDKKINGKFDLITAYEVFEHHPNVWKLMKELKSFLKPKGIIIFSTFLSDDKIIPNKRLDWFYVAPRNGHISIFSEKSIKIVAEKEKLGLAHFNSNFHLFFTATVPKFAKHLFPKV